MPVLSKQSAEDIITEQEKMDLLNHLRRSHGKKEAAGGTGVRKIALKRKTTTELHQPASGRPTARSAAARAAKTVSVEVRRKRTVIKPQGDDEAKQEELLREAEEAKRAPGRTGRAAPPGGGRDRRAPPCRRGPAPGRRGRAQRKSEETTSAAEDELRRQAEEQARLEAEAAARPRRQEAEQRKAAEKPAKKGKRGSVKRIA